MHQQFFENKKPWSFFRIALINTGKRSPLGNPLFKNLWTHKIWERYWYDKVEHLRRRGYGYRVFPNPKTIELINLAIHSNFNEDIIGACRLLFSLEYTGKEYREKLIESLEENIKALTKARFELIYEHADLNNRYNLKDIMHKHNEEITKDYNGSPRNNPHLVFHCF